MAGNGTAPKLTFDEILWKSNGSNPGKMTVRFLYVSTCDEADEIVMGGLECRSGRTFDWKDLPRHWSILRILPPQG
jgi:hypothetical protein